MNLLPSSARCSGGRVGRRVRRGRHARLYTAPDELIIPNHLIDRKRNVLLRLEGDDPLDLFRADWRQSHEAGENGFLGYRVVNVSALDLQLTQHLA